MKTYQNYDTGEIMTYDEMREEWRTVYDGDDQTNILTWREQYKEIEEDD